MDYITVHTSQYHGVHVFQLLEIMFYGLHVLKFGFMYYSTSQIANAGSPIILRVLAFDKLILSWK